LNILLHVPIQGGGNTDESERLSGGGAIKQDDVVFFLADVFVDIQQKTDFLHTGENGQFFRQNLVHPGHVQQTGQVHVDVAPVALDFFLDIQFLNP